MKSIDSTSTLTVVNLTLQYHRYETMPERLAVRAASDGITVEQLMRRLISDGMREHCLPPGPCPPAETFSEYLANAGALIPDH